ncbi:hypothetical protein B0H63DRAFT_519221 [Podospora didyma]|uniref:Uncharacterized protein n=1 Tax=Podospora didyma TaxID=330526 RepID=A0AAE0NYZ0_9PEZI|nr:hypothetical protein B0H63DRAFT_519221 [Podospora didyma]
MPALPQPQPQLDSSSPNNNPFGGSSPGASSGSNTDNPFQLPNINSPTGTNGNNGPSFTNPPITIQPPQQFNNAVQAISTGAIIGIVLSTVAFIIFVTVIIILVQRWRGKRRGTRGGINGVEVKSAGYPTFPAAPGAAGSTVGLVPYETAHFPSHHRSTTNHENYHRLDDGGVDHTGIAGVTSERK